jgi:integrase
MRDVRVAPNIYKTERGWRVYIKRDGIQKAVRFKRDTTLEQLQAFVDGYREESARLRQERQAAAAAHQGTFAGDVDTYLELASVRAMPSYADRRRDMLRWVNVFGKRPRARITARDIDEHLQAWIDAGKAPSTVNKYRTALMSLYTKLDGRAAVNPVKHTRMFEEPPAVARGIDYTLLRLLLDAMPEDLSQPIKGVEGSRKRGSKTRVRFELMAWTGMTPAQIKLLTPRHVNLRQRWYIAPTRQKGHRRPRHPRAEVRKPMTADAHRAFQRFAKLDAWGSFDTRAMRHTLERARRKVEKQLRKERRDPRLVVPRVRPYDFRHSFGTELYRRGMQQFARAAGRRKR